MYFNILPIHSQVFHGVTYRGPAYLQWRYGSGLDCRWSLKDFGNDIPLAVVITERPLPVRDEDLRAYGIDTRWIERAQHPRERLHRMLGVAFAMQAGVDRPDLWLGRDVYCGFGKLAAYDSQMQYREQESQRPRFGEWVLRGLWWVSDLTGRMIPVIAGGALPATDTFTTGANAALTTYSASWSLNFGNFSVLAASDDFYTNNASNEAGAFHNVETYDNNQYAQITVSAISDAGFVGPATRCGAASVASYMHFYTADTSSYLAKMVTGTWTQLGSTGAGAAVSNVIRLESNGTSHRPMVAGATQNPPNTQTDAALSSGKAGISGWSNSTDIRGDNFEGGNLAGAAASFVFDDRRSRFQSLIVR